MTTPPPIAKTDTNPDANRFKAIPGADEYERLKAATAAADAQRYTGGPCPACKEAVQMYLPPDRSIGGPLAYPALLLHYEAKHAGITPPAPAAGDEWEVMPPAPAGWQAIDKEAIRRGQPQTAGVWPPVRQVQTQPE